MKQVLEYKAVFVIIGWCQSSLAANHRIPTNLTTSQETMFASNNYYDPSTAEYLNPESVRRVAIVTGGNSGIGWFTVLHLYLHGYVVYVAGRNEEKVTNAIEKIKEEANKRVDLYTEEESNSRHLGKILYIKFDCCDLKSVERCATAFLSKEKLLHLLINNAGLMAVPFELTKDNFEIQYQVNFVAPMVFTLQLLPALKAAKADAIPRVVNLTSMGHQLATKYYDPADTLDRFPSVLYAWIRYANAKTALIHFTKKFAQEYPGIIAIAVHPGVITDTQLYSWWDTLPYVGRLFVVSKNISGYFIGVSQEEGCLATLRAALDEDLNESNSGSYMVTGGRITAPSSVASSKSNIDTTWNRTLETLKESNFSFLL